MGAGVSTTSACTSTHSGRAPSSTGATTEPEPPARRSARNSALGSATGCSPSAPISIRPSSSVEPKRCFSARSIRSAWWRSPSNDSTVSTTCSSDARPGERAVLGDVADEQRRDARSASRAARAVARRRAPARPNPARPASRDRARSGSSRSRARRGASSSTCASTAGSDVSCDEEHVRVEGAEPLGPQPHLRGRLLGAHEQAPGAAARPSRRAPGAAACSCPCPARRR